MSEKFVYNDDVEILISQCAYCRYKGLGRYCDAFDEIPMNILLNEVDHRKPVEGDRDIQFEPNEGVKPEQIDRLFK